MKYRPEDLGPWLDAKNAEVTVYHMWDESVVGIARNDTEQHVLTFSNPGGHPPGTHEYELSARLLKHALETAPGLPRLRVEVHINGWPREEHTLDDADTIVVLSDGSDRNVQDHPLLVGNRLEAMQRQMDRGCGLVAMHWTVFVPQDHGGPQFLDWIGGYFDYQSGSSGNKWYSKIQTAETTPRPLDACFPCRTFFT